MRASVFGCTEVVGPGFAGVRTRARVRRAARGARGAVRLPEIRETLVGGDAVSCVAVCALHARFLMGDVTRQQDVCLTTSPWRWLK